MKQAIKIEGNHEAAETLFLHLAILLAQHELPADSMVWTTIGTKPAEVRVWLVIDNDENRLKAFTEECRSLAGVQYLAAEPAENRTPMLDRIQAIATRSPFEAPNQDPGRVILPRDADFTD